MKRPYYLLASLFGKGPLVHVIILLNRQPLPSSTRTRAAARATTARRRAAATVRARPSWRGRVRRSRATSCAAPPSPSTSRSATAPAGTASTTACATAETKWPDSARVSQMASGTVPSTYVVRNILRLTDSPPPLVAWFEILVQAQRPNS